MDAQQCPLCSASNAALILKDATRDYHRCDECDLIFLNRGQLPALEEEIERYGTHRNYVGDPSYEEFLRRLADPVLEELRAPAYGLDFGCGSAHAMASILHGAGHTVQSYDPIFSPDATLLQLRYDFVLCSEVFEHFHHPARELALLARLLRPSAILGVMTRFHPGAAGFGDWWYRRDPTHVSFYSERSMRTIAEMQRWEVHFPRPDVAIFSSQKSRLA